MCDTRSSQVHRHFRSNGTTSDYCDSRCIEASVRRVKAYAISLSCDLVVFDQLSLPYVAKNHSD
ncbi:hypothetical protein D3C78_1461490 [compost metagenome]